MWGINCRGSAGAFELIAADDGKLLPVNTRYLITIAIESPHTEPASGLDGDDLEECAGLAAS
jgi:hypothetical protein